MIVVWTRQFLVFLVQYCLPVYIVILYYVIRWLLGSFPHSLNKSNPASNKNLCTNNENLQTISKKSLVTSVQEPQSAWHDADFSVLYTTTQIVKYLMFGQLSCQCPAFTTMKIYRDLCSERNISYVLRPTQREGCRGSIVIQTASVVHYAICIKHVCEANYAIDTFVF